MSRKRNAETLGGLVCVLMMCAIGAFIIAEWFTGSPS